MATPASGVIIPLNRRVIASLQGTSRIAGAAVALIGCLVLMGWLFGITAFKSVLPGLATMKANTALAFILAGASLWMLLPERPDRRVRRAARICAGSVVLIAAVTLAEYLFGWDLGIDQLLLRAPLGAVAAAPPGRMALATAADFLLIGVALLMLDTRWGAWPAQVLSSVALLVAMVALVGYIYNISALYAIASYSTVALHTSISFVILCVGILCGRADRGLVASFASDSAGGVMGRRLLPAAVGIPLVLGWLKLLGERTGLYTPDFGVALFALSNVVIFIIIIRWTAGRLLRMDVERERAREALRASEERFRLLVTGVQDYAIFMLDPSGRIVSWNAGAERIKGYRADEMIGRHFSCFYLPEEQQAGKPAQDLAIALADGHFKQEGWRVRKDGSRFWASELISSLYDESGRLSGFAKVTHDITLPKQAEEQLREAKAELEARVAERAAELRTANERLRQELAERARAEQELRASEVALRASQARLAGILDIADDAVIAMNTHQVITLFNQGAERIFGYTAAEVIGQSLDMLLPTYVREIHGQHFQTFAASVDSSRGMGTRRDVFGRRRDGAEFPAEASISKLIAADEVVFTVILRDITDRKQAETRLRASLREKEILLQELHHRVKNNLQVIKSLLRLQASTIDDSALHELFRDSQNRVHAMALVHEQLYRAQDLAHVDCAVYLRELAMSVLRSYEDRSARIALICEIDDAVVLDINTAIPLGLILTELVSNSLKHAFIAGRTGTLTIGLHTTAETLTMTVRDDGVGIPATVDLGTTISLGLQLVGDLTEQLGGAASIDRSDGTSFQIHISRIAPKEA